MQVSPLAVTVRCTKSLFFLMETSEHAKKRASSRTDAITDRRKLACGTPLISSERMPSPTTPPLPSILAT
eukprot:CAMPEP_0175253580 /NCGR_PEP_ID=MMETSP0093-20121207/36756_1 /TAXON_ID=311494 /ORGANISM="Alexandrium monilatum, Strain CCMP3105" /LENGTH=69 /DNA_ID=CAMNT_0016547889 /DNA_START=35 /DNA_END=244 /DNA_ORIENTATION=+